MKNAILLTLAAVSVLPLAACSNYRESGGDERPASYLSADAQRTIDSFRAGDPTLAKFFDKAHAIVVFPTISKGGLIAGARQWRRRRLSGRPDRRLCDHDPDHRRRPDRRASL